MTRLNILLSDIHQIQEDKDKAKTPKNIAFFSQRLTAMKYKLRKFGQRYNIVKVTVVYSDKTNAELMKVIYYTDVHEADALEYTKSLLEVNYTIKNITAIEIPVGRLEPLNKF